ncbi:hypothetical protein GQ55_6G206900 [Panicum hallii var. hallii]|uniref:Leucine-rich repeat-containing N-terminal plant-type domain-containing protein n=1 Tax=Panicum hallii var. hallii TaxID=1504633 RepID=A0A2T7D7Y2_9POAL|nr:hypothetical protein GQ55_6G206900 [Panicum hallii var. hallii]
MVCLHHFPSYLLLVIVILATSGGGCHQDQSAALLRLRASFRFPDTDSNCPWFSFFGRTLLPWKVDTSCCTWDGITCDGTSGHVTALDLSRLCISGNLSSSDIFELTSLRSLSLAFNNFDANPWPNRGFEQLTELKYLDLSYSGLSGALPVENGQLSNLVALNLSGLDLKNLSLHTLIDSLGNLQKLHLEGVNISASPADLAHASTTNTTSGLKELIMGWCTITSGRFDTDLANLLFHSKFANLVTLYLNGFDLKNLSLHTLISSLGNLQELYLEEVNIWWVSPSDLAHASSTNTTSSLKELSMWQCTIKGGHFDTVLTKLPFLSTLILDDTNISGPTPVPEHFADFSSLAVLRLYCCGLTGTFPSWIFRIKSLMSLDVSENENLCGELPEFIQGSALQVLRLSGTKFSGKIPESIGSLRNLTELDLSNCLFYGPIPSFSQWPMISSVDLSGNNLTGSLPSDGYLSLHNLAEIDLSNNSISGAIPASLFSHPSLEYLVLSQNNFTGNFLLYPNISSSLIEIDVSFNKLEGPLPKLLSKFVGLALLDLSSNNLTGTVDLSFIKNYKRLDYLSLSYNKLSVVVEDGNHSYAEYPIIWAYLGLASCNLSYVPKFLMHQRSISDLDLSSNNIGGHIPDWIWGIGSLALNLSHNSFTSVNTNLSNTSIHDFDLHSNKIEGALPLPPWGTDRVDYSNNHFNSSIMPEFWSRISSSTSLSLANNSLIGEVSHLICSATNIEVLDLSFNSFSGLIPPCLLKHNEGLEILNLRGNNFHGPLPQDIINECALQIIDLNGNKLEGKLPVSMINCQMLQVLDLGNNLIVDTYPEWLGVLPLLKVLVLKSNGFHGPIDYEMKKQTHPFFPELQVLDLSSNYFNGSIPTRFLKQFKAMMVISPGAPSMYVEIIATSSASSPSYRPYYRESVTVSLKGQETTLVQILSVFMYIDLSNNNFMGVIPNAIGDLKFLKQLNLSRNSFTGEIPPRIANMLQLESLDLSYNQLSGEIPPVMAMMSFLEVLNLSYNHLSGMIPQSSQFLTFPNTSFLGNDRLCGKPLARLCETNHAPSAAATPGSSKELNWEFLSVEVGVVSGLAIVAATMLLWGNGRGWVYWHVDMFWLQVLQPWICRRRC